MKFINYLSTIAGVSIYPLISLLMFVLFFTAVGIWVFKVSKEHIREMEQIPLSGNEPDKNQNVTLN